MNVVCHVLHSLPDYSDQVVGVHAMYRVGGLGSGVRRTMRETLLAAVPESYPFHLAAGALFLLLTPVVIWYLLVRTFGLRAESVIRVSSFKLPAAGETARYIVYGVPARERPGYFDALPHRGKLWLDLRDVPADASVDIPGWAEAVALDQFDVNLADIDVVRQRVALLERLLREKRRVILLFVSTEPLNFVTSTFGLSEQAPLVSRLATALARFELTYHSLQENDPANADPTPGSRLLVHRYGPRPITEPGWREALVRSECRHPDLWNIRDVLLNEPELEHWSKRQIVQQVQSRANAIYQHMWSQCTRAEKFTLIELARGNPINPNNWDAARRLRLRGFVRTDPFYRIANGSLKQFVARMQQVENVASWRAESPGAWNQIKVPLVVLLVGSLVFVAMTQPDLFNSLFAFLAAGAASFPFLVSAFSARLQRAAKGD